MLNNNKKQETQFFGTKCGNANSIAAGYATETTNYGEIATGILNKSTKGDNPNSPEGVVGDPKATLFSVGCGTKEERKNALEVKGDGSVIISGKDGSNVNIADLAEKLDQPSVDLSEYVNKNELAAKESAIQKQIATKANAQDVTNAIGELQDSIKNIAVTGGASTATAVTFDNAASGMTAVNAQSAIEELNVKKLAKADIVQEPGNSEELVISQKGVTELVYGITEMESSYIDITDNYEFSNGAIPSLKNKGTGSTFNGDYSASNNNYKHLILDTQEGEEFYVFGKSNDYYNIATFINTTTNTVKADYFRNTGSTFLQKIVTPEGANQVVFIFYIKDNAPFGIYKKMGGDNLEGGMWYDLNYQASAIVGYFALTPKDSTSELSYFTNQQVAIKEKPNSACRHINISVKEGEIYRVHVNQETILRSPINYVILDDNDTIVDICLNSSIKFPDYIKIPTNGTKLIVNFTNFSIQPLGPRQDSYIQKYEKRNITGTEISNQLAHGGIAAIRNGKVGDVLPNLTITGNSFEVNILTECSAGDIIYCNIHNQSDNNYILAFVSHDNKLLYKRVGNTTKVMQGVAPEGTKYVYISFFSSKGWDNTIIDDIDVYINNDNARFDYIEESISNNTFIVPSTFRCIVGQQKVIYYDNLIKGKDDGLSSPSSVACTVDVPDFGNKDMNYDRCWSIPADQVTTAKIGSHTMALRSYDYKLKLIDRCAKTIKVIPKTGLTSNHNIVIIGDSNIDGSYILKTIYDRFMWLGGVQPTFVGSNTSVIDGVTIKHEGKSGTTVDRWTSSSSSFWNSETRKLDVSNYRSKNNISGYIDVAVIALGINDCILTGAPSASSIKPLVDAFLEDNPNCKVILELPHLGANTMGGGWMAYPYANRKILYYNNVLAQRKSYIDYYENTPEYIGKVVIGEGCYCIDRYYGFPNSTQKMSNIIDVQEFVHTNCVHPNNDGYKQEGYAYFVTILDALQMIEAQ